MTLDVTFRGMEATPALQEHIEERFDHALRHLVGGLPKTRVVVGHEDTGYLTTVELNAGRVHLNAKGHAADLYDAINLAADRLARQLDDQHAKRAHHR